MAAALERGGRRVALRCAAGLLSVGFLGAGCDRGPGEAPPQPIAFDHSVHVERGLVCTRCHRGAARAKQAGLPPMEICARCHRFAISEHPEVAKLLAAFDEQQPIRWRKVNVIPEQAMVHFNHAPHARAGVECAECHGDVASMTVAEPFVEVGDMGWCIECHREREATVDCIACHY